MIQRIQSIFLFLAAVAAFSLFVFPFATTDRAVADSAIFADQLYTIQDNVALLALFAIAGGLAFVSIFLFNNRKTQLLVGRLAVVANLIGLVLAIILFLNDRQTLGSADPADGVGLFLPFVFLIFGVLALRYINKDEKLVRSMDRLR